MDLAGLHFDGDGVRLSDDMFDNLTSCLHEYEVRNARDVGHVVGLLQYCRSAFEWPDDIPRAEFSDLLSQLNAVAALPAESIPSSWLKVYPLVRDILLRSSPLAYCDPASIISDVSCLVMVTDASGTAVAVSLFRVKMSDASTVTKAGLLDASKSQLTVVCYKKLHKSALNWRTFEAELHAIVLGCSNFGLQQTSELPIATSPHPSATGICAGRGGPFGDAAGCGCLKLLKIALAVEAQPDWWQSPLSPTSTTMRLLKRHCPSLPWPKIYFRHCR